MKKTEQGVLQQNKLAHLFVRFLLPILLGLSQSTSATNENERLNNTDTKNHDIHLIYTHDSRLQSSIAQQITTYLKRHNAKAQITHISPIEPNKSDHIKPELIVAIGLDSIKYSDANFITPTHYLLPATLASIK